jgi:hypothetical protein
MEIAVAYKVVFLKGDEIVGMTPWVDREFPFGEGRLAEADEGR